MFPDVKSEARKLWALPVDTRASTETMAFLREAEKRGLKRKTDRANAVALRRMVAQKNQPTNTAEGEEPPQLPPFTPIFDSVIVNSNASDNNRYRSSSVSFVSAGDVRSPSGGDGGLASASSSASASRQQHILLASSSVRSAGGASSTSGGRLASSGRQQLTRRVSSMRKRNALCLDALHANAPALQHDPKVVTVFEPPRRLHALDCTLEEMTKDIVRATSPPAYHHGRSTMRRRSSFHQLASTPIRQQSSPMERSQRRKSLTLQQEKPALQQAAWSKHIAPGAWLQVTPRTRHLAECAAIADVESERAMRRQRSNLSMVGGAGGGGSHNNNGSNNRSAQQRSDVRKMSVGRSNRSLEMFSAFA